MKIKTGVKCPCCGEWAIVLYDTETKDIEKMISGKSRLPADIIAHKEATDKDLEAEKYFADNDSKVKNFSLAVVGFQLIIGFLNFLVWQVFIDPIVQSTDYPDTTNLKWCLYAVILSFGINLLVVGITFVTSHFHKKKYKYEHLSENESLLERVSLVLVAVNGVILSVGYLVLATYIFDIMETIAVFNANTPLTPWGF